MPDDPIKSSKRVLAPAEHISEVLFGLIMVLTFTGSLSVAEAGRDDVRTMLIGALGGDFKGAGAPAKLLWHRGGG